MGRWVDYIALAKPRVTVMVLGTAGLGLYMAPASLQPLRAVGALSGTALIVAAANALNMYIERDIDGLAPRTKKRPLPAGRLAPAAALRFAVILALLALPLLAWCANPLTALLGLIAFVVYIAAYTPMKQTSPGALVVGAIPGAMPPLMGWTAATGQLDLAGLTLFSILFLWQLPHFLAISLYRRSEYQRAGYRLTVIEHGISTAKMQIVLYLLALCPVTLLLVPLGIGRTIYLWTALLAGLGFLAGGVYGLRAAAGARWARALFSGSLVYLMVLSAALVADRALSPAPSVGLISPLTLFPAPAERPASLGMQSRR
ncbi:MAG: protoheme IX farnesyltransferase [Myxococcales bacterium]|nr:protoheme IX farnesyltransferase [Myxococcales bacterium]